MSGRVKWRRFTFDTYPESDTGDRNITSAIAMDIILNEIIKYLNFNENTPIMLQ